MTELIKQALKNSTDTLAIAMEAGAVARTGAVFGQLFPGKAAIVVADERTMEIAGRAVEASLREAGIELREAHVFPGEPELYAQYGNVERLRELLAPVDAVAVAVGAGTLNDIVKRASGELERAYLVVGTAASMDGYTAFGSSIALDGLKQTLSCPAPAGCVADLEIMAAAPQVMTASGYGDLLGKVPAGADWILADALGVEAVDPGVWEQVQGPLRHSLSRPAELADGDIDAVADLAEGLLMSGLAMQSYQSSRPASGAEHQFSHLWEMEGHGVDDSPRRLSHGFKVGIGSVAVAALYELLLEHDLTDLDVDAAVAAWPDREALTRQVRDAHSDPQLQEQFVGLTLSKWIAPEQLRERLELLKRSWPELAGRLKAQLVPAAELQAQLRAVGAPAHPSDIGLDWDRFRDTYHRCRMIRNRYTVLDLAFETGLLPQLVDSLFAPDGFWGGQR